MKVSLVSITKSLIGPQAVIGGPEPMAPELTPEQLIVYIARVSNPSNQLNSETSDKLIAFLIKNKHWSPFEMVDMTVEIITSRGIAQQILRHRSFSFQEFSQRYAEVTEFEPIELRKSGAKNRQSSTEAFDPIMGHSNDKASDLIKKHIESSESLYKILLDHGVAKECARFVLPITTQTRLYMKGSVRSWIHYLQTRLKEDTQLEHRLVAQEIAQIFAFNFPHISLAL